MANNPHAETYQGKTQFSGPIKAGSRWMPVPTYDRTTVPGTISVTDLPNTGYVVMSQSAAVEQVTAHASVVDIVLPAGSMMISMQLIVTTAFDGAKVFRVVVKPQSGGVYEELTLAATISSVGVWSLTPGTVAAKAEMWKNINNISNYTAGDSVDIRVDSDADGTGRAILTISYIPGLGL